MSGFEGISAVAGIDYSGLPVAKGGKAAVTEHPIILVHHHP